MNFKQPNFNQPFKSDKKRYLSVIFFVLAAMGVLYFIPMLGLGEHSIDVASEGQTNLWQKMANIFSSSETGAKEPTIDDDPDYTMPKSDDGRWDLLVMGMRGEDQKDADTTGALLTDSIMLISYDQKTGKTSMVSIPRDLYLRIYGTKKDKINVVYEMGLYRGGSGLNFAKKLFSRITGVYIDSVVIIDFSAFDQIITELGGVDITLDKPFSEKQQWGYEFSLPAGKNHLDAEQALYYARSRFSSSDFDRAERQQKIIMALKDKITAMNILSDPVRTLSILNTLRNNIKTDLDIWDIGSLITLSNKFKDAGNVKKYVMTTENLLYESHVQTNVGNLYILLPKEDNLQGIKQMFRDILK